MDKAKINRWAGSGLLIVICCFCLVLLLQLSSFLLGPQKSSCTKSVCLARFLEGPPVFNDAVLKNYLRKTYFEEPSRQEYNLKGDQEWDPVGREAFQFLKNEVLKNKRNGVFVVLGAGDGEYRDYTLSLEKDLAWSGLLVEPLPHNIKRLKEKHRKALISTNCVSPFAYPITLKIAHEVVIPSDSENHKYSKHRRTKLAQLWTEKEGLANIETQCIPLENILFASGITSKIDLLVLDMAGTDLDILLSVKFDQMPDFEATVVIANGNDMSSDIGGYFLERNLVMKKIFGQRKEEAVYILTKFEDNGEL